MLSSCSSSSSRPIRHSPILRGQACAKLLDRDQFLVFLCNSSDIGLHSLTNRPKCYDIFLHKIDVISANRHSPIPQAWARRVLFVNNMADAFIYFRNDVIAISP